MASGLLKYVGRNSEPLPLNDGDKALQDRIKARMERMGMVEDTLPEPQKVPSARGKVSHIYSNRQMIADHARVTPRSLKLIHATKARPESSQISQGELDRSQNPDSLSEGHENHPHSGDEGGMFDTDAENLDSTTHLSELDQELTAHSWPLDKGARAEASGSTRREESDDEGNLHVPNEDRLLLYSAPGILDKAVKRERIDTKVLSFDEDEDDLHGSDDRASRYGSGASHGMLQKLPGPTPPSLVMNTPLSKQRAIQVVLESPSIQQSLAYRITSERPVQPGVMMPLHSETKDIEQTLHYPGKHDRQSRKAIAKKRLGSAKEDLQDREPPFPPEVTTDAQPQFTPSYSGPNKEKLPQKAAAAASELKPVSLDQGRILHDDRRRDIAEIRSQNRISSTHPTQQSPLIGNQPFSQSSNVGTINPHASAAIEQEHFQAFQKPAILPSQDNVNDQDANPAYGRVRGALYRPIAPDGAQNIIPASPRDERLGAEISCTNSFVKHTIENSGKPEIRKRVLELDYSPEELSSMTYRLLIGESFDHVPKGSIASLPTGFTEANLVSKIQYAYDVKNDDEQFAQRRQLFTNLTIEQYEEAGDVLLDKFSTVLGRYKEARRSKRMAARQYEREITQREETVRSKITAVTDDMTGLKQAGQRVVQGQYA